jgi:leader peptidase (prepilin peptidase)/N-methyltransferase
MLSIAAGILLGLLVGSFLNVVIYRLPIMLEREWREQCEELLAADGRATPATEPLEVFNLLQPRSRCPACGAPVRAWQNIPVVSWLLLGGRCSSCKTAISVRYPLVELATGLLSGLLVWRFGATLDAAFALLLLWSLVALTMIDIDQQLLPDSITLPLLWLGLFVGLFQPATSELPFADLRSGVIGAMVGYCSLWSVYWLFRLLTGKEGMGYGDFKLLAALGAWLGWQMLPLIILLSALAGAIVGVTMIVLLGRDRQIPIPFGPYLATAGLIALLWGPQINTAYLRFSGL